MITELHTEWTIEDICSGFVYNEAEGKGLYGMNGKLTIQPEYQRNYIYGTIRIKAEKKSKSESKFLFLQHKDYGNRLCTTFFISTRGNDGE